MALWRLGLVGPALFWASVLIAGALTPGYSHLRQYISELGAREAPHATLMNFGGIMPFGISISLLAIAAYRMLEKRWSTTCGLALLLSSAILFVVAGVYRIDPVLDFAHLSRGALIHNLAAFTAFVLGALAVGVVGASCFRRNRAYSLSSLGLALVCIAVFALMSRTGVESMYRGAFQRLFLLPFSAWLVLTAMMLGRRQEP